MFKQLKKMFSPSVPVESETVVPDTPEQNVLLINAYCTKVVVPDLGFPHQPNGRRSRPDPELLAHLDGFIAFVESRGDGAMSSIKYQVLRHIQRTCHHLSFSVEDSHLSAMLEWVEAANAILFLEDGSVRNSHGEILVSAVDGSADADAVVPYPLEAWERKARMASCLATKGLDVPAYLPPVIAESELQPRPTQAIIGRAQALALVAIRAESVATSAPISAAELEEKFPSFFKYLTPAERAFMDTENPSTAELTQFSWRYESLFLLEWALGMTDALPFPDTMCDAACAVRIILSLDNDNPVDGITLRPASDILDALDLHCRLHWLVRQAQVEGKPSPGDLNSDVILERHYALNWLVRFEDSEWDKVDTPT